MDTVEGTGAAQAPPVEGAVLGGQAARAKPHKRERRTVWGIGLPNIKGLFYLVPK